MTRLIEADKLTADILALNDCPNGYSRTYDKSCIIGIIEEQPAVEAIPIEWMLKWDETLTDESKEIGSTVNWNIVKWMILEWRKEHEQID